ncbi:MAG: carboxypeptidase-like regulatory domain-containing protein [Bacteroidota bacterium]|nr:carboxypeptidase-like regulatory domain-containing protein [Bacteroidota bacterium]MDP4217988.1 carboxypeptidase-like regulatory domain-containing protein [Bacteroidota bacterium]MDP4247613.1 carboxypeptidase-like regulatory domain-containing protein [Bacteroidota bacterium]MDP4260101.1 carboxypeptidase-like regulatory domain-containing protein [Bacteroidota bacterium]
MNITKIKLAAIGIAATGLFSFHSFFSGTIRGTVSPADGATRAWAESSTDTVKALVINGSYEITDVKPGTYKVIIEAKPPYKNAAKDGVSVADGQSADAGEIRLEK